MIQGSDEWKALRRTKITATDAPSIMGVSKWRSRKALLKHKLEGKETVMTDCMQRGLDLEPLVRNLFVYQTGIFVKPDVVIKDWAMASLDGISENRDVILEIKCAGEKDHAIALEHKVPKHYFPQLQHQMYVCEVESMYYYSFDGFDSVYFKVARDQAYIDELVKKELEFLAELEASK